MYLTHSNILYSEKLQLISDIPYPQYVHMVTDGGMPVAKGLRTLPEALVRKALSEGDTSSVIRKLTSNTSLDVGFILATGGCAWTGYLSKVKRSKHYPTHKILPLGMTHIFAGKIANNLGNFDYISTDSSSCTSGHSAWNIAKMLIDLGKLDAVVVLAVDNSISEESLFMFAEQGLSKLAKEEDNTSIVKFRLGQGLHIGVFESKRSMGFTHNLPLAEIEKIALVSEVFDNPVGISETGEGYQKAIDKVRVGNYDFIKPHGTYSNTNQIEEKIIVNNFPGLIRYNYKLDIGHTMGASTALETALAIKEHHGRFISLGAGMGNTFSAVSVRIFS